MGLKKKFLDRLIHQKWLTLLCLVVFISSLFLSTSIVSKAAGTPLSLWTLNGGLNSATGYGSNIGRSVSVFGGTGSPSASSTWWGPANYCYVAANNWIGGSGTKGFKIAVDTRNFGDIKVSFSLAGDDYNGTNVGPKDFKLQYSLNDTDYFDVLNNIQLGANWDGVVTQTDIALPNECADVSSVYLRWIMTTNNGVSGKAITDVGEAKLANIDIKGTEIPKAPTDIALSNNLLASNSPSGTPIGTFSATDPNSGDTLTFSLVDGEGSTNNSSFSVVGNELRTSAVLGQGTYSVRVKVNDGTFDYAEVFTIDAPSIAPSDISLSKSTLPPDSPSETTVGYFTVSDLNAEDTHTLSLVEGEGASHNLFFSIVGNELKTNGVLDQGDYSIRVNANDGTHDYSRTFIIYVGLFYPESHGLDQTWDYITHVSFNTIDNDSDKETGGYGNYTGSPTVLMKGQSYTLTVINPPTDVIDAAYPQSIMAWIDWNNNGSFDDAGEAYTVAGGLTQQTESQITITVPESALCKTTRMRISIKGGDVPVHSGDIDYGEVEDYSITIDADTVPPTVVSIDRKTPVGEVTNATSVVYSITFNENTNGIDIGDFSLVTTGTANGTITDVSAESGTLIDITVTSVSGDGTLRLDLNSSGTNLTDDKGNTGTGGFTSGQTYTIDNSPPSVSSIDRYTPINESTNLNSVVYRITFNENVDGVDTGDFSLITTDTAEGTITSVSASSGTTIDVTVDTISGSGTLKLVLKDVGTGITDVLGNTINGGYTNGQIYSIDLVPPVTSSINRLSPGLESTNADTLVYRLTFSENVTGVDTNDFILTKSGTANGSIASVSDPSGTFIDITVSSVEGSGTLRLDLKDGATGITDNAGNPLSGGLTGEPYTVDRINPQISSINRYTPTGANTNSSSVIYRVTFSESVAGIDTGDFSLTRTGMVDGSISSVSASSGSTIDVTVDTISGGGTLRLDLKNTGTGITDTMGNPVNGGFTGGQIYTVDRVAPGVVSINRNNPTGESTNGSSIVYEISFSESVSGVDTGDFFLYKTGTADGNILSVLAASGTSVNVTIDTLSGEGSIRLDLKDSDTDIVDGMGNSVIGGFTSGQSYLLDITAPEVVSVNLLVPTNQKTNATSVTYRVTFSESITGLDSGDFALTKTGTVNGNIVSTTAVNGKSFDVLVNSVSGNGNLGLELKSTGTGIADSAGNSISGGFTSSQVYDIDQLSPSVSSIVRKSPMESSTNATSTVFSITFSENVTGVDIGDFTITTSGTAAGTIISLSAASGITIDVTVDTISGDGSLRLDLNNSGTGITDGAGNAIMGGYTLGEAYTIDTIAPSVTSIDRNNPTDTHTCASSVIYRVTFSEPVSGLDTDDFILTKTGTADGSIASVSASSGSTVDVTVDTISGEGTLRLDLKSAGTDITDTVTNEISGGFTSGQTYTVDRIVPVVSSINRYNPTDENTNASTLVYRVTFSESVSGVDTGDFALTGIGGVSGNIASVSSASGQTIDISITGVSGDGTLSLDLKSTGTGITDALGNPISGGFSGGQTYSLDRTAPQVIAIERRMPISENTNAGSVIYRIIFSEEVAGVDMNDFNLIKTGTADGDVTSVFMASGTMMDITVDHLSGEGTLRLDLKNTGTGITDSAGNPISTGHTGDQTYSIDRIIPQVVSINRSNPMNSDTNSDSVTYLVSFSENVDGVNTGDFTLTNTGSVNGTIASVSAESGSTIEVTVESITGEGTLRLDLKDTGTSITDAFDNAVSGYTAGQLYTVDRISPSITAISRENPAEESTNASSVTYGVSFSENVSGIDVSDFTLTKTGSANGSITSVSASGGTTVNVTVSNITGEGTLKLELNNVGTGIVDSHGNEIIGGFTSGQAYTVDRTEPVIVSLTPSDGANNAGVDSPLAIAFNEDIVKKTGSIKLYKADGSLIETIAVTTDKVEVNDRTVTINPDSTLLALTDYYIIIDATAFDDTAGNSFAGIGDNTAWNFITVSDNANLSDLVLNTGTLSPAFDRNVLNYTVSVGNGTSSITITPTREQENAVIKINGADSGNGVPSQSINLGVGSNTIIILVKAQDNVTTKSYSITITRATPPSPPSNPTPTPTPTPTPPPSTGEKIIIGEELSTIVTKEQDNKTVTTITADDQKIDKQLQTAGNNATVVIPVQNTTDVVVGELNGQTVKNMEEKEAVLEIKTENVTYTLPASQINIDAVSSQIGEQVALKDIKVSVTIAEPPVDTVKIVEDTANKNNYQVVVRPVEFNISCTSGEKTVEVSKFNGYVERMVAVPSGIDPFRITTGIVLNSDGTFSHVPTTIIMLDGKYFAKINSLTNSTYSVIWNPISFSDVEKHWAKNDVNDMGSRLVIGGVGGAIFQPDRSITRAEFASIVVRALGLMRNGTGRDVFNDVRRDDWYYDTVAIAYDYGIISGCGNGRFMPDINITRQDAMIMIARAMKIAGMNTSATSEEMDQWLGVFSDGNEIASGARQAATVCVKNGILGGFDGKIRAKTSITRAETAAVIRRMLIKAGLIK